MRSQRYIDPIRSGPDDRNTAVERAKDELLALTHFDGQGQPTLAVPVLKPATPIEPYEDILLELVMLLIMNCWTSTVSTVDRDRRRHLRRHTIEQYAEAFGDSASA